MEPRQRLTRFVVIALAATGAVLGGASVEYWRGSRFPVPAAAQAEGQSAIDADVERLKTLVPSQSHGMTDVGYQWNNLWFAAEQKNWPLAEFYLNEARQHIQWTILIRPVRKDAEGRDVDLKAIFDALNVSAFATLKLAIAQKDTARFVSAYKQGIEGCYSCHKAAGKAFLRPVIPRTPAQNMIDFAPGAAVEPS